ncbi:hypothetical protein C6503_22775 [Candidatus Poribacteria bacterium]|nr:MAG: hypothetical protein C6503_22775 [Candidatus Poribacteria bacterium]
MKNQIDEILEEEQAAAMLENIRDYVSENGAYAAKIKAISEETLLQIFESKKYSIKTKYGAVEMLVEQNSTRIVAPLLQFLNSFFNFELDSEDDLPETAIHLSSFATYLGYIPTLETYEGLKKFLNRLLAENPGHKQIFLNNIIISLARVSIKLSMMDAIPLLRAAISYIAYPPDTNDLRIMIGYFDDLNDPESIKKILTEHVRIGMGDIEYKCLNLLQKYDPDFVKQWQVENWR